MKKTITLLSIMFCLHTYAQTTINEPPTVSPTEVCISTGTATVTIPSSQTGIEYALVIPTNTTTPVGNPALGTGGSLSFPIPTVTTTTVYEVIAFNSNNSTYTTMVPSVTVTVVTPTTAINAQASYSTICFGTSDVLTASYASSYTWSANAGSSTTNSVTINPTASTIYTVTGVNACLTITSATVAVTVNPLPTVTVNSPTVCNNSGVPTTLTAGGANSYTWSANTGSGTTNSVVINPTTTTVYTVTGTDSNNCTNVVTSTVTVYPVPATVTVSPASYTVCPYTPVTFTASGANTYTWNGSATATGASINVIPAHNSSYYYQAVGTDANGCISTSLYVHVYVNSTNYGTAFSTTQQLFTTPPFVAQFNNTTPNLASMTNFTFTWLFGDGQSQQTNNASVFHTYSYNGTYDVTLIAVYNSSGCADTLFKGGYIYCTGGVSGLKQVTSISHQLNIYPNPSNGNFIIETNSSEKQMLKIFDVTGKLVLSQSINDKANIDASNLNTGIYNLSISNSQGVINKRIVITK